MEAECAALAECGVVGLEVDFDDAAGLGFKMFPEVVQRPDPPACGKDRVPFDVAENPTCAGHGGGEGNDAAVEGAGSVFFGFDLHHATGEAVANALPAALERGVLRQEESEKIQHGE